MFSCNLNTKLNDIEVEIVHHKGLFKGSGGQLFGQFLGGYAETIISKVIASSGGKYADYTKAELKSVANDGNSLKLKYQIA